MITDKARAKGGEGTTCCQKVKKNRTDEEERVGEKRSLLQCGARAAGCAAVDTQDNDLSSDSEVFSDDSGCGYELVETENDDEEMKRAPHEYRHFETTFPLSQIESMNPTVCCHAGCLSEECTYVSKQRITKKKSKSDVCEHNRRRDRCKVGLVICNSASQ